MIVKRADMEAQMNPFLEIPKTPSKTESVLENSRSICKSEWHDIEFKLKLNFVEKAVFS